MIAELNAALNRASSASLPVPKTMPEEAVAISDEQLIAWLEDNNPELSAMSFMAAREKAGVDLAKKNYYPDIMVGVDYMTMKDPFAPGMTDMEDDMVMAMLSINVPIWYGKYRAAEREARARYETSLNERSDRENSLLAGLEMALYGFRDAERKIDLYRDTLVPKAEQSLKVTRQAYEAGRADFLDLLDAQRALLEFKLSHERARADRAQRLAEIEMLVGREVPRSDEPQSPDNR
jgi:outer membrane protein TolC